MSSSACVRYKQLKFLEPLETGREPAAILAN